MRVRFLARVCLRGCVPTSRRSFYSVPAAARATSQLARPCPRPFHAQRQARLLCSARARPTCLYKVLGVAENAPEAEIKTAYRKLAMKWHPDRNGDKSEKVQREAETRFKSASEAYTVLSDPTQRRQYDAQKAFGGGAGGGNPFSGHHHGGNPFSQPHGFHFGGGGPGGFTNEEAERVFREAMGGGMGANLRDLEQQMRELERHMQKANSQQRGEGQQRRQQQQQQQQQQRGHRRVVMTTVVGPDGRVHQREVTEEEQEAARKVMRTAAKTLGGAMARAAGEAIKTAAKKKVSSMWDSVVSGVLGGGKTGTAKKK